MAVNFLSTLRIISTLCYLLLKVNINTKYQKQMFIGNTMNTESTL